MAATTVRDAIRKFYAITKGHPVRFDSGEVMLFPESWYWLGGIRRNGTWYDHEELSPKEREAEAKLADLHEDQQFTKTDFKVVSKSQQRELGRLVSQMNAAIRDNPLEGFVPTERQRRFLEIK